MSNDVVEGAKLPVFWGDPILQGLHIGLFIAIAALLVFWIVLNRSTTGYEVRAVGLNPEAARYSGMSVGKNYVLVMAACGAFAGLAGSLDVLGWQFRLATNDIQLASVGFTGIAVALLGRNTALGTAASALLFGALLQRYLAAESRCVDLRAGARREPHVHHPGPRHRHRERRRARPRAAAKGQGVHRRAAPADPVRRPRPRSPAPMAHHLRSRARERARRGGRAEPGRRTRARLGGPRPGRAGGLHRAAADHAAHARALAGAGRRGRRRGRIRGTRRREAARLDRDRGRRARGGRRGGGDADERVEPRRRVRLVGAGSRRCSASRLRSSSPHSEGSSASAAGSSTSASRA